MTVALPDERQKINTLFRGRIVSDTPIVDEKNP